MPARMKDIAQKLGVSVVTVSKALRGFPGPSEETRARVLSVAKEMNYGPNLVARALVSGRTYSIGLVIPDLVHPFFAQIAKSIAAVLHERGLQLDCLLVRGKSGHGEKGRRAVGGPERGWLVDCVHPGPQLRSCAGWRTSKFPMYWWIENSKGWTPTLSAWTTCAWELWARSI